MNEKRQKNYFKNCNEWITNTWQGTMAVTVTDPMLFKKHKKGLRKILMA